MHVGKGRPRLIPGWFDLPEYLGYGPTRQYRLGVSSLNAVGTVAENWAGRNSVRQTLQWDPDFPYEYIVSGANPIDALAVLRLTLTIAPGTHASSPNAAYHVHSKIETFYNGVMLAWSETDQAWTVGWQFHHLQPHFTTWYDRIDPAQWFWADAVVNPVSWAEQPEYHPYRH